MDHVGYKRMHEINVDIYINLYFVILVGLGLNIILTDLLSYRLLYAYSLYHVGLCLKNHPRHFRL